MNFNWDDIDYILFVGGVLWMLVIGKMLECILGKKLDWVFFFDESVGKGVVLYVGVIFVLCVD